jgi:hypothetical protein
VWDTTEPAKAEADGTYEEEILFRRAVRGRRGHCAAPRPALYGESLWMRGERGRECAGALDQARRGDPRGARPLAAALPVSAPARGG